MGHIFLSSTDLFLLFSDVKQSPGLNNINCGFKWFQDILYKIRVNDWGKFKLPLHNSS